jgi:hypothetical protein
MYIKLSVFSALNVYNFICQLYLSKAEKNKEEEATEQKRVISSSKVGS